jgi:hypothetical protein
MATKVKSKKHFLTNDPDYQALTPGLRQDIDDDVKKIARQEAFNGGLKWGLVALICALVILSVVL